MTWTDPSAAITLFQTGDVFTESNFKTYILDNLLSLPHPLEAPTTADNDVNTTASETTFYSVTVPANSLGTNGMAEMLILGDYLFNNSTADTCAVRVKFGGVTILGDSFGLPTSINASRWPFVWRVFLANKGATNSQWLNFTATHVDARVGAPTTGWGGLTAETADGGQGGVLGPSSAATIDTTVDQTLLVSVQFSASSANNSIARRWARTLIGKN